MLIDEPTMPPHPFLPPLLEKLSLLQRLHRHASSLSHWAHLMWMLPLSIFTAIGLLHLTTLLRSSPTMQRAADGVLHLIELAQDALHAVIKLCRWYWRDRLQPLESAIDQCTSWIDDRAHAVAGSINTAAAAAKGRIQLLSNSITRSSNAVRSALASAVQLSLPHPGQLWTAYVLPIYESTKSSLHGAASSQLFLRLVSFGDRLSTGVRRTDEWVSLWLRGASHLVRGSRLVVGVGCESHGGRGAVRIHLSIATRISAGDVTSLHDLADGDCAAEARPPDCTRSTDGRRPRAFSRSHGGAGAGAGARPRR